jgi:Tfp pilus assembly protein PilP
MRFIKLFLLCLVLSSCSQKHEKNDLQNYSDMGAAEDAGKVKP